MSTNGWGKASINNTNGFGDGAINNDIGWGDSQLRSWSGETDIDGGTGIPVNTVAPVISGATTLGSVLSTTNGTWTAKPAATFTYQWKRNGSNIIGATNSTYTLVNEDGATNITCQVTATNDFGSASATSNTLAIPAFTDADAQAFITAASITNPTQQSAINTLVTDLKGYGVWSKMKALYPFVGGTASQHKFNLKDPRDLDAAFRLVFNGGGTHSSTGYLPNGTNGYADTKLVPSTDFTTYNHHISLYSRTNNQRDSWNGAYMNSGQAERFILRSTDAPSGAFYYWSYGWAASSIFTANTDSRGLFLVTNRSASDREAYRNGTTLATNTFNMSAYIPVSISLFIGSNNVNGSPSTYDNKEIAFGSLGDGLTDTEAANFYTAVQTFQTTLSRNV